MDDKSSREAAISARIAAIRAQNEALERRHAEVEADRQRALKQNSAVDIRHAAGPESTPHAMIADREPKVPPKARTPAQERLRREPVKSRIGDRADGPPPDPGYSFLADRLRDESDSEDQPGPPRRGPEFSRREGGRTQAAYNRSRKNFPESSDSPPKSVRPPPPFGNGGASSGPQRYPPGFAQQDQEKISKPFNTSGGSAQSRLAKFRQKPSSPPPQVWKCPDPYCDKLNAGGCLTCDNCGLKWDEAKKCIKNEDLGQHRKVVQAQKGLKIQVRLDQLEDKNQGDEEKGETFQQQSASNETGELESVAPPVQHVPPEASGNTWNTPVIANMAIGHWTPEQTYAQPAHWLHQHEQHQPALVDSFVIGTWNQAPDPQPQWQSEPASTWTNDPGMTWVQHTPYPAMAANPGVVPPSLGPPPQGPYMPIPFNDPGPIILSSMGSNPDLIPQNHQTVTHITQHSVPIMATQAFSRGQGPPRYSNASTSGRGRYSRPAPSSNSNWREKEVTRIPPRFQKQRLPVRQQPVEKTIFDPNLPRTSSQEAPSSATRLTIFGSANVLNNSSEEETNQILGIPVRQILTPDCQTLRDKISVVDPALDRFVVVHCMCDEARKIALTDKSDLEKGADSDQVSKEFSDIIINLLERIPYLRVFISTALPRFDREEETAMACPNNVRKVMNVEVSTHLSNHPNVVIMNNDSVLEWWKDDVKKKRVLHSDGNQLTPYGFSLMLDHWVATLKKEISDAHLCHESSPTAGDTSELDVVTPKLESVQLTENSPQQTDDCSTTVDTQRSENDDTASLPVTEAQTSKGSVDVPQSSNAEVDVPATLVEDHEKVDASQMSQV